MWSVTGSTKRRHLLTYFALAFAISWGGVLLAVGPRGIPGTAEQVGTLLPFVVLVMLASPSVAGILFDRPCPGQTGRGELPSRLLKWRVGARWYAVALLTAPLLVIAALFALSPTSPVFRPGIVTTSRPMSHLLFGMAAGLFEELGWTGFAVG